MRKLYSLLFSLSLAPGMASAGTLGDARVGFSADRTLVINGHTYIGKIWTTLVWAGASVGRSGVATQAIAAIDIALWDLKAKRAGLPLAKLIGASRDSVQTYNTSGGFLHTPIEEVMDNAARSLANGIGGIKLKVLG